jgi:iron complex outermembrane receptor protein
MGGKRSKRLVRALWMPAGVVCLLLDCQMVRGQSPQPPAVSQTSPSDLTQVSIENLMNMEVTSVSKKEQKLSEVAAAIFVITPEDIARSGATNIPDLLRMVPGMDVAQINSNTWAISARGFNFQFASKLLVLIDGRAVYTPLFGGVNWDTQDVPLEDIERIAVIRGPGGAVWGANAVNGVINIITRKTEETLGVLVTGGGGTYAQGFGTVQYGGKIKNDTTYRRAKYFNNDHYPNLSGQNGDDGWHLLHGGFRVDTILSKKDTVTIEGDICTGSEGAVIVHSTLLLPTTWRWRDLPLYPEATSWAGGITQFQAGGTRLCSSISTARNETFPSLRNSAT